MSDGMGPPPGTQEAPVVERLVRVDAVENGDAWVTADRMGGCGGCPEKGGCGHAALLGDMPPVRIRIENRLGVRPGDWVMLGVPSASLIGSAGLAYGLPLVGFLAGAITGAEFGAGVAIAAGVGGLALMALACRYVFTARRGDPARPVMLRLAPAPERGGCSKP